MAQKFVSLEDAAELLGISEDKLKNMRSEGTVHAYRDGGSWKFKQEEVDRVKKELAAGTLGEDSALNLEMEPNEADSILLSEVELGEPGQSPSSTVIGKSQSDLGTESDIQLAGSSKDGSDLELASGDDDALAMQSDVQLASENSDVLQAGAGSSPGGSKSSGLGAQFDDLDELDLDLESESSKISASGSDVAKLSDPGDSDLTLGDEAGSSSPSASGLGGDSTLELAADDDDELVLGEGSGSDITLSSGDSGISLADPADSGLSLDEEPLELGGSTVESLELGEDDEISLEGDSEDSEAATQLKADDDFLLTPMEGSDDGEDSGSQVIALDSESFDENANTMLGAGMGDDAAALADDLGDAGAAAMAGPGAASALMTTAAAPPETPYSVWNVMSLLLCIGLLSLTGMMMYDLLRNMWSWNQPFAANSALMDGLMEAIPIFK